jgi:anti-sigma B factor antagonist
MQWSDEARDGSIIGSPQGRVDEASWQAFGEHLGEGVRAAASAPARKLVVNLAALDYMSSRGLRALTLAKREADSAGIAILLAAPNGVMREILAISRYDKLFTVTDTIEAAL